MLIVGEFCFNCEFSADSNTKIGEKAYRAVLLDDEGDPDVIGTKLAKRFFGLHLYDKNSDKSDDDEGSTESDDEKAPSNSPIPDDVNSNLFINIQLIFIITYLFSSIFQ